MTEVVSLWRCIFLLTWGSFHWGVSTVVCNLRDWTLSCSQLKDHHFLQHLMVQFHRNVWDLGQSYHSNTHAHTHIHIPLFLWENNWLSCSQGKDALVVPVSRYRAMLGRIREKRLYEHSGCARKAFAGQRQASYIWIYFNPFNNQWICHLPILWHHLSTGWLLFHATSLLIVHFNTHTHIPSPWYFLICLFNLFYLIFFFVFW